jgi:Hydrazine synthase alpha subunit middle domain
MRRATMWMAWLCGVCLSAAAGAAPPHPIVFVTQTPFGQDFTNVMSTFGTHRGTTESAPRGGDLWIRYADGTLRNLTAAAGYGTTPSTQIAVRDPHPHWDGTRVLISMVVGGTTQNDDTPVYFQIYEVTGFGQAQTVQIRKLAQPGDYNNVSPIYASDGRILFTSDRPRNGDRNLYPQLDEYETAPTVTGLWSMQPDGSELRILDHAPSGVFTPIVDSFGRVIFSRWDHLQRDQQGDAEIEAILAGDELPYEAVTYDSETSDSQHAIAPHDEVFPEPRQLFGSALWDDLLPTETAHTFNHFFPWAMHQDGTGLEILDHLGRHELANYIAPARTYLDYEGVEQNVDIFLEIAEDPTAPGTYYGIRCPEFGTRGAGQIVSITAPPGANPDAIAIEYVTHPATASYIEVGETPEAGHTGMFRDPVVLSDGSLWAAHSSSVYHDAETVSNPSYPQPYTLSSRYDFAIRAVVPGGVGGHLREGARLLAAPIVESVSYFDNDRYRTVNYSGPLWELQPIEVVVRDAPPTSSDALPAIEHGVLGEELGGTQGIEALRAWLASENLALVVSRDVTVRADRQQDFNLKIAGSDHQTAAPGATPKEIAHMQFFEGRQLRGFRWAGRRVLARPMSNAPNPSVPGAPPGAVRVAADGSMAAFVPAGRALSWQSTEPDGTPVVRERYWLTFQPGEIRVCGNCHGLNTADVFGGPAPDNEPQALRELVQWWQTVPEPGTLASALGALAALALLRAR